MTKSRFTTEQIIGFIKQADAGMAVAELAWQHGFSPASLYAWRAMYGGMEAEDAKRLNEHWFTSLAQVRKVITEWRRDYNEVRSYSSCARIPPASFAANHLAQQANNAVTFNPGFISSHWYGQRG
jgi:putative transposase